MKLVDHIVNEIQEAAFGDHGVCADWDSLTLRVRNFNQSIVMSNEYTVGDRSEGFGFNKKFGPAGRHFDRLKIAAYSKGRGSWLGLVGVFRPGSHPDVNFLFDEALTFEHGAIDTGVSAGSILSELAAFPRYRENIPGWMADAVEAAGEPVIFLDPHTDDLVYGMERSPYKEPVL